MCAASDGPGWYGYHTNPIKNPGLVVLTNDVFLFTAHISTGSSSRNGAKASKLSTVIEKDSVVALL